MTMMNCTAACNSARFLSALALVVFVLLPQNTPQATAAGPIGYGTEEGTDDELLRAVKLINLGSYASAIPLLKKAIATDPRNPDAFSLMGFSQRKIGKQKAALGYYYKALELEPAHLGANEYLGELYLEMDDLTRAEERLEVLKSACGTSCDEYRQLEKAVLEFKSKS